MTMKPMKKRHQLTIIEMKVWLIKDAFRSKYTWVATWHFQQRGMCDQQSLRSACAYAQSDQSLCLSFDYFFIVQLLTEHHFKFQSLKGGFTCSSESVLVKLPHSWKSHVTANQTEISTSTDIRYLYLIIVFALTFSAKVMKTNLNNITWNVRGNIKVSLHAQHIRKA